MNRIGEKIVEYRTEGLSYEAIAKRVTEEGDKMSAQVAKRVWLETIRSQNNDDCVAIWKQRLEEQYHRCTNILGEDNLKVYDQVSLIGVMNRITLGALKAYGVGDTITVKTKNVSEIDELVRKFQSLDADEVAKKLS